MVTPNRVETVLWPVEVKSSGYFYGWTDPVVCVIGVLGSQLAERLRAASSSSGPEGEAPIILGLCSFDGRPNLTFQDPRYTGPQYYIIYYHRFPRSSLRFYALYPAQIQKKATVLSVAATTALEADTYCLPKARGLNLTTLHQMNSSHTVDVLVSCKSDSSSLSDAVGNMSADLFVAILSFGQHMRLSLPNVFSMSPFKDVSGTIQQFDVRVEQFEFFLVQTRLLRARNASPVHVYARQYTEFFNTVWLLLNDITIGVAVGSFLCDNHVVLSHILDEFFQKVFVQWIEWVLFWLDAWPAGLKLNTELSHFYSRLFAYLIRHWGDMVEFVFRMHLPLIDVPFLPAVIYALGLASCCGVTITISICADMLSFVTAHLYLCYIVTSVVYHRMLETAGSLWNLFRGKRFNVLRNRTDTWEYDIDQLLFGTIVFTLLAFLFPTVLAYYSLFALMRLSVIVTLASLDTLLAFMNHFPLFALMLRIKDPQRIPGGIYFEVGPHGLVIKSQPVPMSSIFSQYILLSSHLASHYNPLRLLRNVLRGDLLTAIPRVLIRFSKGKGVL